MRLPGLRLLCGFWESLVSENIYKQRQLYKSALLQTGLVTSKLKISESKKGIATRGTGWKQSEATISKIGQAQVGALNHMYGKKHSMETKMKMKESHKNQAYLQWLSEGNTPEPAEVTI